MNTVQLECFMAVAEHLNFSKASRALKITQPAVSHQIQTLEEELETKLFVRTSKNVALTQEGILFLADAQLILKTALSAKERLSRHEHLIPFELGCHNYMELNLLPPVLKELSREFPLLRPSIQLVPFPPFWGWWKIVRSMLLWESAMRSKCHLYITESFVLFPWPVSARPDIFWHSMRHLHGAAVRKFHRMFSQTGSGFCFCHAQSDSDPSAAGEPFPDRKHRQCPDIGKGPDWVYAVSGYSQGKARRVVLYSCDRSSPCVFRDFLPE